MNEQCMSRIVDSFLVFENMADSVIDIVHELCEMLMHIFLLYKQ